MYCHKCGNLLPNEVKFCPNCGEKVFVPDDMADDCVVLNITSAGVDNELFSNIEFEVSADGIHIGSMPGKGMASYKITSGPHCIKVGVAAMQLDIPNGERSVTLDFIWGPDMEQRIICQQSRTAADNPESGIVSPQGLPGRKPRKFVWGIALSAAAAAVAVVGIIAVSAGSVRQKDVSLVIDHSMDKAVDSNKTIMTNDMSDAAVSNDNNTTMSADALKAKSILVSDEKARKAYAEKVRELAAQDEELMFDLIDLDGSGELELVADRRGYEISVFTWADGKLITLMDKWIYGVGGRPGYSYLPGRNVIYSSDMDMAGAIISKEYWTVNRYYEVASLTGEVMTICYFYDINRNGIPDEGEEYSDEPFYYFGDTEITEEEYEAYQFEGEYDLIMGDKTCEEILELLNEGN